MLTCMAQVMTDELTWEVTQTVCLGGIEQERGECRGMPLLIGS